MGSVGGALRGEGTGLDRSSLGQNPHKRGRRGGLADTLHHPKMDAIKKKMQSLKTETENSLARAEQLDAEATEANKRAEKTEEHVRDLQKKMQHVENDLDITIEKLSSTTTKLDEKDKSFQLAEGEIQALKRKMVLTEDELERSETKGTAVTADLNEASERDQRINKAIRTLEHKNMIDEERIDLMENQVKEAKQMAEERDNAGENKIVDLEEELRVIGENLKALEVAEEKAQQREEEYKKQIRTLTDRLKSAESRAEYGEKTVQKLNLRIDNIMFDLVAEKMKTQNVNDELDQTFELFVNH